MDRARVKNYVLFASDADLAAANLTAAVAALQAASAERYAATGGAEEAVDPLQLRVWQGLARQEVQLQYDRRRCRQLLAWHDGAPPGPRGGGGAAAAGGGEGALGRAPPALWRAVRDARERHAAAVAHWVAMRSQFGDAFWLA
jgi:hypothetical protein